MTYMRKTTFGIFLSLCSCFVLGGEFSYVCDVHQLYDLNMSGSLETFTGSSLEKLLKKRAFSVSRETGALTGNSTDLDTSLAKSIRVINKGSKTNSFESIADFGDFKSGSHPYLMLKIEEFRQGSLKPFVLMGTNGILTGVCK